MHHLERVDEPERLFLTTADPDRDHGPRPLTLVLVDLVFAVIWVDQPEIPDLLHLGMCVEEGCDLLCILALPMHPQTQRLEASHHEPSGVRRCDRAENRPHLSDLSHEFRGSERCTSDQV